MSIEENNNKTALYLNRRSDLIYELIEVSKDKFYNILKNTFLAAKNKTKTHEYILRDFQDELEKITQWKDEDIKIKTDAFEKIGRTMNSFLTNIHFLNQKLYPEEVQVADQGNLSVLENFVKLTCQNMFREMWKQPYLMYDVEERKKLEKKKEIEDIIRKSIETTIRRQSNLNVLLCIFETNKNSSFFERYTPPSTEHVQQDQQDQQDKQDKQDQNMNKTNERNEIHETPHEENENNQKPIEENQIDKHSNEEKQEKQYSPSQLSSRSSLNMGNIGENYNNTDISSSTPEKKENEKEEQICVPTIENIEKHDKELSPMNSSLSSKDKSESYTLLKQKLDKIKKEKKKEKKDKSESDSDLESKSEKSETEVDSDTISEKDDDSTSSKTKSTSESDSDTKTESSKSKDSESSSSSKDVKMKKKQKKNKSKKNKKSKKDKKKRKAKLEKKIKEIKRQFFSLPKQK